MKTPQSSYLPMVIIATVMAFIFCSCNVTIQKRLYRPGFTVINHGQITKFQPNKEENKLIEVTTVNTAVIPTNKEINPNTNYKNVNIKIKTSAKIKSNNNVNTKLDNPSISKTNNRYIKAKINRTKSKSPNGIQKTKGDKPLMNILSFIFAMVAVVLGALYMIFLNGLAPFAIAMGIAALILGLLGLKKQMGTYGLIGLIIGLLVAAVVATMIIMIYFF
jgi:hypothetical protein